MKEKKNSLNLDSLENQDKLPANAPALTSSLYLVTLKMVVSPRGKDGDSITEADVNELLEPFENYVNSKWDFSTTLVRKRSRSTKAVQVQDRWRCCVERVSSPRTRS